MTETERLAAQLAKLASGSSREAVIDAAANLIMNALRQSHPTREAADEELRDLTARMHRFLAAKHYNPDGGRRETRILTNGVMPLMRQLAQQG